MPELSVMRPWLALTALIAAASAAAHEHGHGQDQSVAQAAPQVSVISRPTLPDRPAGSNMVLNAPITISDDLEVIISDVIIPPDAQIARHYHPGEEFLYIIEGAATHVEEGREDLPMVAGDSYAISPGAIHSPIGGPQGARAIVFRVHIKGKEERILVPGPDASEEAGQ